MWPDPRSVVLADIDFGTSVHDVLGWLRVRDFLTGTNKEKRNISKALALARTCKHPDAEWIAALFHSKDVWPVEEAREIFLKHRNDARALCFAWFLLDEKWDNLGMLKLAADLRFGFALAFFGSTKAKLTDALPDLEIAASQNERMAFELLGRHYQSISDFRKAKRFYLIAANLGAVVAANNFGMMLSESNPIRWLWLGRAASRGFFL